MMKFTSVQQDPEIKQPSVFWKIIRRFFFWTLFSFLLLVGTVIALAFAYEDEAKKAVIDELNKHLNAEVKIDPANIDFTIIRTFPNAAVEFRDAMAYEALKKEKRDTLFSAGLISLQFNVLDLLNGNYKVKILKVTDAQLNLKVDKKGNENYIFWKKDTIVSGEKGVSFKLEKIELEKINISYRNRKSFIKIKLQIEDAMVSGAFDEANYTLKSAGAIFVRECGIEKRNFLADKTIKYAFDIDVNGDRYNFKKADADVNKLSLETSGFIELKDSITNADLNFNGKNIDVRSTLSLLPQVEQDRLKDYSSDGLFYVEAKVKGNLRKPSSLNIQSSFGIQNAVVTYTPDGTRLNKVNFNGRYEKVQGKPEKLELKNISAILNQDEVKGNFALTDFNDPYLELDAEGRLKLEELFRFYPVDTIESVSGGMKFNIHVNGSLAQLKSNFSDKSNISSGSAEFNNVNLKFKRDEKTISIASGLLSLQSNNVKAENFALKAGKSDALVNGSLENFIGWLLKPDQLLAVDAKVSAGFISLDELLAGPESKSAKSEELNISDRIKLALDINVAHTVLGKFEARDIAGRIIIKDKKIFTENLSFETMDGDIALTGMIDAQKDWITMSGSAKLISLNITKLFYQMNNFGQESIQDKHLKGKITSTIDFSSKWSRGLVFDPKSIVVGCDITIEQGELVNYKPLESLSNYVEMKELKAIRFSTLQSHIDIKNELISISKTSIRNSAMNMDFYGTHSFNNEIDYHFKLLLSEVLAKRPGKSKQLDEELALVESDPDNKRCVFITMTGTIDNPVIRYDRKGMKQKIKEDIKAEKQNLKQILFEEFGLFKKDTANFKKRDEQKKSDQKFQVDFGKKPDEKVQEKKPSAIKPKSPVTTSEDDEDF